ncbi:hypothetical protein U737_22290 [Methylomonas sp. LW13]|nr:hypothetical protein CWO84_13520 [Methylomonas sp. Kb3]QBC29424.1 hypothetical protein U737_22290 [Methylomonas sp. LW13]
MRLRWLKGAVAVLRRAIRRLGANQAVVAIVLVAADALFFDQVVGRSGRSVLIQHLATRHRVGLR